MTDAEVIVVCVDGSENSIHAATSGLALLQPNPHVIVATVIEASDPSLVTGAGHTGGIMSPEELDAIDAANEAEGQTVAVQSAASIGLNDPEVVILRGEAGRALCNLATERGASAIVMGSRGRGAFKRALLGSVSDHVVRNAPCPVIITNAKA